MPESLTARFARILLRYRLPVLVLTFLGTLALLPSLRMLQVGYSVDGFLASAEPELRAAAAHYEHFEAPDNLLLFGFQTTDPFAAEAQQDLAAIETFLRSQDGVRAVVTMQSAPGLSNDKDKVLQSRLWRRFLVGADQTLGGIAVLDRASSPAKRELLFEALAQFNATRSAPLHFAGLPFHRAEVIRRVAEDQRLFLPLCALLTIALLAWLIPCWPLALLAMLVVPFTLVTTLAVMAAASVSLTLLTSTLPTLLMAMSVADGVHLVQRFIEERRAGLEPVDAARQTAKVLLVPCFLTSATTAVGFLALTWTRVPDLQDLGLFAALGVGCAFVFTMLILPPALSFVHRLPGLHRWNLPQQIADRSARLIRRPRLVLGVAAVLVLCAIPLALQVDQNSHLKDDDWEGSATRLQVDWYERHFVHMIPSEVVVRPKGDHRLQDPLAREELRGLVAWLESLPGVDRCLSVVDLEQDGLPAPLTALASRFLGLQSEDRQLLRILVFQQDIGNRGLREFAAAVEAWSAETTTLYARAAGIQVVATALVNQLTDDLVWSFLGSLLLIFAGVGLSFRSARLGLAAMMPNLLPLLLALAVMSVSGITLRPLTAITFCIAFCLAVDDTIHMLARYREERAAGQERSEALDRMVRMAGRPVVVTTLLLLTGFLTILSSTFKSTFQFGLMTSIALLGSMIGALLLLPAMLSVTDLKRRA